MLHCQYYDGPERTPELIEATIGMKPPKIVQTPKPNPWFIPRMVGGGGCGCKGKSGNATIYRWIWMLWYGWPFPLRKPWKKYDGCGCIKRLKDWNSSRKTKSKSPDTIKA